MTRISLRTGVLAVFVVAVLCASCDRGERRPRFSTWESAGQRPPQVSARFGAKGLSKASAAYGKPWAGVVSHHLLADALIDRWFATLAEARDVKTFYLASPSHWGLSTEEFSLTDGSWLCADGAVGSDLAAVERLRARLGVTLEAGPFAEEHGASTLMPYIRRYFPKAKVAAVCYNGEPPVNIPMAKRLTEALAPEFDAKGKRDNFFLVSSDFSHHADARETAERDARGSGFFESPTLERWILVACDNRPGLYALASLADASLPANVLFHSDSFELSGMSKNDITSYFFAFFR